MRRREEREYSKLVDGTVQFSNSSSDSVRTTISDVKSQISIVANMFICAFAMFGVGYYVGVQYQLGYQARFMCGLVGAVIILFVEMVLYIIRACNMECYESKHDEDKDFETRGKYSNLLSKIASKHRRKDDYDPASSTISKSPSVVTPFESRSNKERKKDR